MYSDYRLALLEARLGVAERCLLVGGLYGDLREVLFWRVALYYMLREKHRKRDPQYNVSGLAIIYVLSIFLFTTCTDV